MIARTRLDAVPVSNQGGWNGRAIKFKSKLFVHTLTGSVLHVPYNMGSVFARVQGHIDQAEAHDAHDFIVLSRDLSAWKAEHLFSVSWKVPGEEHLRLSGDFLTKVFEGPYRNIRHWHTAMQDLRIEGASAPERVYFFYTTCPRCAKTYRENYVVGVAGFNITVELEAHG